MYVCGGNGFFWRRGGGGGEALNKEVFFFHFALIMCVLMWIFTGFSYIYRVKTAQLIRSYHNVEYSGEEISLPNNRKQQF